MILLGFVLCAVMAFSQSQRLVLLEEFTQASCGPCATVNPTIEALLNSNPEKITSVWYHTSWPGYDPMNLHNPVDVAARVGYYMAPSNQYVPYSVLDGNYYNGSASGWNINTVNARYAVPSPFELHLRYQVPATNDSVYLTMLAKCTQAVSGPLLAHNIVIETNIHFNTPPGSNGEKDFKNVMDKMLPTKDGTTLPTSFVAGDYQLIETSWKFANVYDVTKISGIGFIQNKSTKEIHQSCNATTDALVMPYNNDLQVMSVSNVPTSTCTGTITPVIRVRNNGNNLVSAFHLKYQVNDGTLQDFSWSGSLATLQKANISLPTITFTPEAVNNLRVFSVDPNNTADEYPKNDTIVYTVNAAPVTSHILYLVLLTDNNPTETTWDVKNSGGNVITSGGPYTTANHLYRDTITVPGPDCYTFTIYDAAGNGICCANGNGMYLVMDSADQNLIIAQGGEFTTSDWAQFRIVGVGVENRELAGELSVFPNPFNNKTTVSFYLPAQENVTFSVINTMGQSILTDNRGMMSIGKHEMSLETGNLVPGIYLLQVQAGSQVLTRKITVGR
jgi:hypothetical protein